jgi:non-heme chloroperoxidase
MLVETNKETPLTQAAQHDPGQESFVRTPDGLSLSVREWGTPDGPEIVLIHGQAQCYLSFARQTGSDLATKYRIVAFDLRGHGRSEKPLQPQFYQGSQAWADDVASVLEAKRLRRPVLVGWSMGGRVIRNYLMHYGDQRLSGINFLATRPIEDPGIVGPGSAAMRGSDKLDFAARLRAEIGFLRDCFAKPLEGDDLLLAVAYNMIVPPPVRDALAGWSTDPTAATEALRRVSVPTLVTHGRLDRLILPKAAEMTAAAVKGARISWFEDCGHSPFYEDAPRYNRELDQFVTEIWGR